MLEVFNRLFKPPAVDRTYIAVAQLKTRLENAKKLTSAYAEDGTPDRNNHLIYQAVGQMEDLLANSPQQPIGVEASKEYLKAMEYMVDNKDYILAHGTVEALVCFNRAIRAAHHLVRKELLEQGSVFNQFTPDTGVKCRALSPELLELKQLLSKPAVAVASAMHAAPG